MDTDDRTDMGTPKPRRANPMQPDRPTGADDLQKEDVNSEQGPNASVEGAEGLEEQENAALENVREGYGKG